MKFDEIVNYLKVHDPEQECELLSTFVAANDKDLLEFKCNKCGQQFNRSVRQIKRTKNHCCAECARKKASFTIEDVKKYLLENDTRNECILLSEEYLNSTTPLRFKCNLCGDEFEREFKKVKLGRFRCPQCGIIAGAKRNKYSAEDVQAAIASKGYVLIGEYVNTHTGALCRCEKGHEFKLFFSEFLCRGRGCPQCAILFHSGENHPNWNGGISSITEILRTKITPWKKEVMRANNFCCDITGRRTNDLVVHHLTNFSDLVKRAFEVSQVPIRKKLEDYTPEEMQKLEEALLSQHTLDLGVVLTSEVHKEFHQIYGVKDNTLEQYLEFKNNYKHKN